MKLLRSTFTVSAATVVSRILGFLRDMVFARLFGASAITDAFFVAFRIPNFMRRLFAEGAFSLAFVPVLSEYRQQGDRAALKDLVDHVAGALLGVLLMITALGVLAAPLVLGLFAPGWWLEGRAEFTLSAGLLRITFPYILFISLTALAAGILNTFERFLLPALTPVLLNISLITAALVFSAQFSIPIEALAWGVLVAGILQLLIQVPTLVRLGLLPRPRWNWRHSGVRRVLRLMIPAMIGSSVAQINLLVDSIIATFLVAGSVSWLYYSDRLLEFPLGVFGIALSTVILPTLSRKYAAQEPGLFSATMDWALKLALLITVPAAVGLACLAEPILITLFQYRAFGSEDVSMAALSLRAYAVGLPAFIAVKVLAPGFYARQDTKTPVRIAIVAMLANILLNFAFVGGMLALSWQGAHAGLALASSVAAYLNAGLLYFNLRKTQVYQPAPDWLRLLLITLVAVLSMAVGVYWLMGEAQTWLQRSAWERAYSLLAVIGAGAAIYALVNWLLGLRPAQFIRHE